MFKKNKVTTLSDACLGEVANLIVNKLGTVLFAPESTKRHTERIIQQLNEYLCETGATGQIRQDLLRILLNSDNVYLEAAMRYSCMRLLLNSGVAILTTDVFPIPYYVRILQTIIEQGSGLRTLNMKGVWLKNEHVPLMKTVLATCRHLKRLYIPYIANDDLLELIALHSRKLQLLDMSGETDITEIGLLALSTGVCCDALTVVDVGVRGDMNICYTDIALILEYCKNVETLGSYSFVGRVLIHLRQTVHDDFKCNLRYLHDTHATREQLQTIGSCCPKLNSIYLDSPMQGALQTLEAVRVRRLKIYKFQSADFLIGIKNHGQSLRELCLIKGSGVIDLSELMTSCPSLTGMDLYMLEDGLIYTNINMKFDKLEVMEMLNCSMSLSSLKSLLYNSKHLRRIALDYVTMSPEDMEEIFANMRFYQLEDLWFQVAPHLNRSSVMSVLHGCPALRFVGQLNGWDLTTDDLALLRGIVQSANSAVVLSNYSEDIPLTPIL